MTTAYSQDKTTSLVSAAPDAVLKGYIKNYGDAKASWKEKDGVYEATFKLNNMPATAWYDSTGHRLNVVVDVKEEQLPAIARSYIERNYPKAKVTRAQKWTDDKKVSTFQAEIKLSDASKSLLFNSRGDLIKEL
jgi:hypothetical protein